MSKPFNLFLTCPPGLEPQLAEEAAEIGLPNPVIEPGGVATHGHWTAIYKANLWLRGATRVLIRVTTFRAMVLPQLDSRAAKVDWAALIGPDRPVRVEATCKSSRINHGGAVAGRLGAVIHAATGAPLAGQAEGALRIFARMEDNRLTVSLDTSGELLHRRGYKQFSGKAPLRETMAALLLRACGYQGREPVLDPMCGSGTVPIEAACWAAGMAPGAGRGFGFEHLRGFDAQRWAGARSAALSDAGTDLRFDGRDRDAGAIEGARQNAERAGVGHLLRLETAAISDLQPPRAGRPGLVFVNPPYGGRIGKADALRPLYARMGRVLSERFAGWRVGLLTTDADLAHATGLPLTSGPPLPHGGLSVRLWQCGPLQG